jgi:hypothetical protein
VYTPSPPTTFIGDLALHPDGTIFANVGGSVVGIGVDLTTGAGTQKFSVPMPALPQGAEVFGQGFGVIIAGDGYAYYPMCTARPPLITT